MSRPGGLTAMAIFNFLFAALGSLIVLFAMLGVAMMAGNDPNMPGLTILIIGLFLQGISVILLVVAGIGYLKQSRILGRFVGSAYGLLGVGASIVSHVIASQEFGMLDLAFLIYPVLTLILVNSVFRRDLAN